MNLTAGVQRWVLDHRPAAFVGIALLLVAAILALALGSSDPSKGGLGGLGLPNLPSGSDSGDGGGTTTSSPGGTSSSKGSGSGSPSKGSTPSPDPSAGKPVGSLPLQVVIIPFCGISGSPMRAEITTTPDAALTIAVTYENAQTYGQFGTFRADSSGKFIYPWSVPAAAPVGRGRVLIGADGTPGGRKESAAGYWEFRVASPGEC